MYTQHLDRPVEDRTHRPRCGVPSPKNCPFNGREKGGGKLLFSDCRCYEHRRSYSAPPIENVKSHPSSRRTFPLFLFPAGDIQCMHTQHWDRPTGVWRSNSPMSRGWGGWWDPSSRLGTLAARSRLPPSAQSSLCRGHQGFLVEEIHLWSIYSSHCQGIPSSSFGLIAGIGWSFIWRRVSRMYRIVWIRQTWWLLGLHV